MMQKKSQINYPCKWEYRIIGEEREVIEKQVFDLMLKPYSLEVKNRSKQGKFISMHLIVEVDSEEDRNQIFRKLQQIERVKMVL